MTPRSAVSLHRDHEHVESAPGSASSVHSSASSSGSAIGKSLCSEPASNLDATSATSQPAVDKQLQSVDEQRIKQAIPVASLQQNAPQSPLPASQRIILTPLPPQKRRTTAERPHVLSSSTHREQSPVLSNAAPLLQNDTPGSISVTVDAGQEQSLRSGCVNSSEYTAGQNVVVGLHQHNAGAAIMCGPHLAASEPASPASPVAVQQQQDQIALAHTV